MLSGCKYPKTVPRVLFFQRLYINSISVSRSHNVVLFQKFFIFSSSFCSKEKGGRRHKKFFHRASFSFYVRELLLITFLRLWLAREPSDTVFLYWKDPYAIVKWITQEACQGSVVLQSSGTFCELLCLMRPNMIQM